MFSRLWIFLLLLPLSLAGCGDLPRPFQGAPGANAMRLAAPPPSRLAVLATPDPRLMPAAAGRTFTDTLAAGLLALEVPAVAGNETKGDWVLMVHTEQRGANVVQGFVVQDPTGKRRGATEGRPIPRDAWNRADPAVFRQAAADSVPAIADLLSRIQATDQRADPQSLFNRPARVWVAPVEGAPGDGDGTLRAQLRLAVAKLGPTVQDTPDGMDFNVQGRVRVVPIAGKMERVEIQWLVLDPKGRELGRIVQLNEIPAGTLNGFWGDVAMIVAKEAAGGVRDVIVTQSGRRNAPAGAPSRG